MSNLPTAPSPADYTKKVTFLLQPLQEGTTELDISLDLRLIGVIDRHEVVSAIFVGEGEAADYQAAQAEYTLALQQLVANARAKTGLVPSSLDELDAMLSDDWETPASISPINFGVEEEDE